MHDYIVTFNFTVCLFIYLFIYLFRHTPSSDNFVEARCDAVISLLEAGVPYTADGSLHGGSRSGPSTRSWWIRAGGDAGGLTASPLKWSVETRSALSSASLVLPKGKP